MAVRRILHNPMYTGVMVQGKDRKISYKLDVRKKLPQEEWVCVENRVPILIPRWVSQRVSDLEQKHIRCEKGKSFCGLWTGLFHGSAGKKDLEKGLLPYLCQHFLEEEMPREEWMRRLFLVLFFKRIEAIAEKKQLILHTTYHGAGSSAEMR